jgi:hypothetical protein
MGRRVITASDIRKLEAAAPPPAIREFEVVGGAAPPPPAAAASQPLVADDYLEQVAKYIPAEIVAGFVAINGIMNSITNVSTVFQWVVFGALLVLTPLYTWRVATDPKLGISVPQIIIATFAFLFWVFALGGPFTTLSWYMSYYGSIVLVLYTLIIPVIIGK